MLLALTCQTTPNGSCLHSGNLCQPSDRLSANKMPWPMWTLAWESSSRKAQTPSRTWASPTEGLGPPQSVHRNPASSSWGGKQRTLHPKGEIWHQKKKKKGGNLALANVVKSPGKMETPICRTTACSFCNFANKWNLTWLWLTRCHALGEGYNETGPGPHAHRHSSRPTPAGGPRAPIAAVAARGHSISPSIKACPVPMELYLMTYLFNAWFQHGLALERAWFMSQWNGPIVTLPWLSGHSVPGFSWRAWLGDF